MLKSKPYNIAFVPKKQNLINWINNHEMKKKKLEEKIFIPAVSFTLFYNK